MAGMKQILLMMAAMVLVGCGTTKLDPNAPANITDPIVEEGVRNFLRKPTGELTNAELANVTALNTALNLYATLITDAGLKEVTKLQNLTELYLGGTKITDAGLKEVAKLRNLTNLSLTDTKITDAGAAELKKALPKCEITHSYKED